MKLTLAWLVLLVAAAALMSGCYRGNPPWPGDPTAPARRTQNATATDGGCQ